MIVKLSIFTPGCGHGWKLESISIDGTACQARVLLAQVLAMDWRGDCLDMCMWFW